jgi:hypothetical protein
MAAFDTVVAWTVKNETSLKEFVALGVNGIITDDPALLHSIVMDDSHKRSGLVPLTPPPASECIGQAVYSWSPKDAA